MNSLPGCLQAIRKFHASNCLGGVKHPQCFGRKRSFVSSCFNGIGSEKFLEKIMRARASVARGKKEQEAESLVMLV
jgi:hypothetical protein